MFFVNESLIASIINPYPAIEITLRTYHKCGTELIASRQDFVLLKKLSKGFKPMKRLISSIPVKFKTIPIIATITNQNVKNVGQDFTVQVDAKQIILPLMVI